MHPPCCSRKREKTFTGASALLPLASAPPYFQPSGSQHRAAGTTAVGVRLAGICVFHKYRWESEGEAVWGRRTGETCDLPPAAADKKWYAVHTRSRHEKVVAAQLCGRGVDTYLPLVEEIHRWSDRRNGFRFHCFPAMLSSTRGFRRDHGHRSAGPERGSHRGRPCGGSPIPDEEIAIVHRLLSHNIPCVNHPFLEVGQRVRIRGGALDGVEGTLLARKGESCLVISIELIQRSLAVRIEGYDVEVGLTARLWSLAAEPAPARKQHGAEQQPESGQ